MYKTLLVPLDMEPFAEQALPLAIAVAHRSGAAIHLVSVIRPLVPGYPEGLLISTAELEEEMLAQRRNYLESIADRLRKQLNQPVFTQVLEGDISSSLESYAAQKGVDLVVLATHARGPFGRFWLGSVADELIRHLPIPVLLIHPQETPEKTETIQTQAFDLHHVLLALDGTELAEHILESAVVLTALWPQAEVTLVRVLEPIPPLDLAPMGSASREAKHLAQQIQSIQQHLRGQAQAYLDGVATSLRQRGILVHTRVTVEDQPALAILHQAEQLHAGLIALTTHGRQGLSRLVLGSVADKVIRGSHVPVLVNRSGAKQ